MKYVVSFSGGAGSFYTGKLLADAGLEFDCVFCDTQVEDEDLYRFINDCRIKLGWTIRTIADGRTPWEVYESVKFMGNNRIDPCSRILKRELFDKYLAKMYEPSEVEVYVGLDAGESHRLLPLQTRKLPWVYKSVLHERSIFLPSHKDKIEFIEGCGLKAPDLYYKGFPHNNCGGFCCKTGQSQMALLHKEYPERYEWHCLQEDKLYEKVPTARGFIRKTVDKELTYYKMRDFKDTWLSTTDKVQEELDLSEFGSCGCFIDESEDEKTDS